MRTYLLNPAGACLLLLWSTIGCGSVTATQDAGAGAGGGPGGGGQGGGGHAGGGQGGGGHAGGGGPGGGVDGGGVSVDPDGHAGTGEPDAGNFDSGRGGTSGDAGAGDHAIAGIPVDLGLSGNYVILAKTGISTVPTSAITGNIGVSPAAATAITGFALVADATNVFSLAPQVTGRVYAANYAVPTPTNLTTAINDMQTAYTAAAGRSPGVTELGTGNIGGMTIAPGVYKWGTGVLIASDVTLSGDATAVWIFQIAQNLTMSSAARVNLSGGALAKNIFWQVAGLVDMGTTAHGEGVFLAKTSITLRTGASINGRLLAQTAVNIDTSTIVQPAL